MARARRRASARGRRRRRARRRGRGRGRDARARRHAQRDATTAEGARAEICRRRVAALSAPCQLCVLAAGFFREVRSRSIPPPPPPQRRPSRAPLHGDDAADDDAEIGDEHGARAEHSEARAIAPADSPAARRRDSGAFFSARSDPMAPSQRSAENFNKKAAAKLKRGIVSTGAAGMSNKGPDPASLKPKELPCPHCDRLFKQQDRLKQHVAKHHAKEVEEAAAAAKAKAEAEAAGADAAKTPGGDRGGGGNNADAATRREENYKGPMREGVVFRASTREPKIILQEYISKKKDSKKPKYVLKEEPDGKGWSCKVVIADKYKPEKDVVVFSDGEPRASKEAATQHGAVAALAVRSIHWFPYDRVGVVNADP